MSPTPSTPLMTITVTSDHLAEAMADRMNEQLEPFILRGRGQILLACERCGRTWTYPKIALSAVNRDALAHECAAANA